MEEQRYIKLSKYAKNYDITYRTAWNRYKKGKIEGAIEDNTGHILVPIKSDNPYEIKKVALYARVSSNDRKESLNTQLERIKNYAIYNGYNITLSYKEVASGMNDNRSKLMNIINKHKEWDILIVENKDRLTRFGFNYIETLLNQLNKKIIVINKKDDDKQDLMQDLISIIYSFSARMYGLRRRKKKQDIINFLDK